MNTELTSPAQYSPDMKAQVIFGKRALAELRAAIRNRPDKVIINKKQYLEFCDWQLLGVFCGITAYVMETAEIFTDKDMGSGLIVKQLAGFWARAVARQDGKEISAAEAECMFDEERGGVKQWEKKPRFMLRSMAETRACRNALRNCLQWVVKLPEEGRKQSEALFTDIPQEEDEQLQLNQGG